MESPTLLTHGRSSAGESAGDGADRRPADHRLGHRRITFVVPSQATVCSQPGQGPLDGPSAGDHREALLVGGFAHDVNRGAQYLGGPLEESPGEGAVGEHEPYRRGQVGLQQHRLGPSRSCIEAAPTTTVIRSPRVSVTMNRLRPLILLPAS
jgi:hypothetical protein